MLKVHHLEKSRSHRILWLLEKLQVPYELEVYRRDPETLLAPPELKRLHPLGKSPVLTDDELTIAESGAILEYILDRYGAGELRPEDAAPRRQYRYWMHYAEGSLMPLLVMKLVFERVPRSPMPFFVRPVARMIASGVEAKFLRPQLRTHLDFIESHLSEHRWFAGEFSAADIQMSFPLEAAAGGRVGLERYPSIRDVLERCRADPSYQRAIAVGGPVSL